MDLITFVLSVLSVIVIAYFLKPKSRPKNFPPGPTGIPIFGNAFQLGNDLHSRGVEFGKTYGPIMGFKMGSYFTVVLNSSEDIRAAFSKPEFAGRYGYNPFLEKNLSRSTPGVVMSQGKPWQDIRRFSLKSLREFGFGKRSMESLIQEEVQELIDEKLRKNLGVPMSTEGLFNPSVLNVIWALVGGERYKLTDIRLAELLKFVTDLFGTAFKGLKVFNFMFPVVVTFRNLLPFHLPDSNRRGYDKLASFLQKAIDEHKKTIQIGSPRDFIDSYLEANAEASISSSKEDDDVILLQTLFDLFGAGSDTTSTTLTWSTFLLGIHQDAQEKMYQEIQRVVGNRTVMLEDRQNLPYTEAVMNEVYRVSSLAPVGVPHATTEDVVFKGFNIPKNTTVFGNFFAVHFSKEIWGDPERFRPERFLSEDGKTFVRNPNILAFSTGKRQCLGETLAKDEHLIFLGNIVNNLKITLPVDEPPHSLQGVKGLVLTPEEHRLIFTERNP